MPRVPTPLSAAKVRTAKPGRYADGHGLYLLVRSAEQAYWLYRYTPRGGKMREMGGGKARGPGAVTLAEAREWAQGLARLVKDGVDPQEQRKADEAAKAIEAQEAAARATTFKQCAMAYIAAHEASWRNQKHIQQWAATLDTYVYPVFGDLPVAAIDTALVMKVLEPIWTTKTETASRIKGRIETILDWAAVSGFRSGENPARWKGHLSHLLPARGKVRKVKHHKALPYSELPDFMARLRAQPGMGARALEFLILTAARTGEVRGATWAEIDLVARVWIVPADRMKARREHRVPLSSSAVALLEAQRKAGDREFIFPGSRRGSALSDMTLTKLLRRMKVDCTAHGFRSTFRDWVAECTHYQRDEAEMALAHTIDNKVEAAYRRGDLIEKRTSMMADWADFCDGKMGKVLPIYRRA
ncbi:tyrosine-type recombinase/integrase [Nitrospirillum sp. BR 11828]|uniref:tyrosine-type recombinase/integrase n=1 Tax=Nitrospirillum sp. BR 11828 TaxID=3104325 RepID=UPI002ACA939A|nr:integrase arm-type DNA-binding domain-containing protein [Nitrospirillum sp. BR 11828]MDZ5647152.1 integrase arm-type DNA-binding domain-containing protein [Nitrospirillum sp. BR 11828]